MIEIDQSPIGRTPRSNPATYTGVFDEIRRVFAATREAKIRGYEVGRFSFNVKGGRCEACQGQGTKCIEMHFLPDVYVNCEVCHGSRYNAETLQIHYRGKTIADVLAMTVEEAMVFFENFPRIHQLIKALNDVGLSYVRVGQPSTQLSGGEAQRVKLATELGKSSTGHTLYVLDEPTTGLHFADIQNLLNVLNRLADMKNTILVIEHNLDVIKCADWIIDMGPEGGDGGGQVIAEGTPEQVAEIESSDISANTFGRKLGMAKAVEQKIAPDQVPTRRVKGRRTWRTRSTSPFPKSPAASAPAPARSGSRRWGTRVQFARAIRLCDEAPSELTPTAVSPNHSKRTRPADRSPSFLRRSNPSAAR